MATQVQSLFAMTPEALQAQRAAALNEQARQFAQMTPMQQAQMGLFRGASQLGTGLAGLMGYQDPEMQRIKARQGLLGGIDMSDPAALREAAKGADPELAQQLIAEANRLELAAAQTDKERALMGKAESEAKAAQAEAAAKNLGVQGRAQFLMSKLPDLTPEMAQGLAQDESVVKEFLKDPELKTEVVKAGGRSLLINSKTGETIKDLGASGSSSLDALAGSIGALAAGMAAERGKKAAGSEGTEVGRAVAQIQSGYNAEAAITDALDMVTQGIYAGGYGPAQELMSKYTSGLIGDKNRLVNTEAFRAYIGNVVIPMMSQLGGSDSNEELKYMRSIVGGETTLEADAIQKILRRAREAVRKDIARKRAQQKAIEGSQPLPTGPIDNKEVNWSDL